jgi:AcrR family transcriptional regulator
MRGKVSRKSATPAARRKRTPVARRKRRSRDDILDRIVRAAVEEFKRYGFTGTTTAAIARKAEVTEAQLFRCFGSKANLFREAIFKPLDAHFLKFIHENLSDDGANSSIREITYRYTAELQRFMREHSDALTSLIFAQNYDSAPARGVNEIQSLSTYFDRCAAITEARMHGKPKFDLRMMVRVSFVAVLGCVMFKDWIFPPGLANDEDITAAVSNFVLSGAITKSSKD